MVDAVIIMSTQAILLLDDQCVDMKFITRLTGLTDKWFCKLIQIKKSHLIDKFKVAIFAIQLPLFNQPANVQSN